MDSRGAAAGLAKRQSGGPGPRKGGRLIRRGHAGHARRRYDRNLGGLNGDGRDEKCSPEREPPEDRLIG